MRQQPSMSFVRRASLNCVPGGYIQRLLELHHRHRRLIAATDSPIRTPRRIVGPVDHQAHRALGLLAIGLLLFRLRKICRRIDEFEFLPVLAVRLLNEGFDFRHAKGAGRTAPGSAKGQISVVQRLETQAGDSLQIQAGRSRTCRRWYGRASAATCRLPASGWFSPLMLPSSVASKRCPHHQLLPDFSLPRLHFLLPLRDAELAHALRSTRSCC